MSEIVIMSDSLAASPVHDLLQQHFTVRGSARALLPPWFPSNTVSSTVAKDACIFPKAILGALVLRLAGIEVVKADGRLHPSIVSRIESFLAQHSRNSLRVIATISDMLACDITTYLGTFTSCQPTCNYPDHRITLENSSSHCRILPETEWQSMS